MTFVDFIINSNNLNATILILSVTLNLQDFFQIFFFPIPGIAHHKTPLHGDNNQPSRASLRLYLSAPDMVYKQIFRQKLLPKREPCTSLTLAEAGWRLLCSTLIPEVLFSSPKRLRAGLLPWECDEAPNLHFPSAAAAREEESPAIRLRGLHLAGKSRQH